MAIIAHAATYSNYLHKKREEAVEDVKKPLAGSRKKQAKAAKPFTNTTNHEG